MSYEESYTLSIEDLLIPIESPYFQYSINISCSAGVNVHIKEHLAENYVKPRLMAIAIPDIWNNTNLCYEKIDYELADLLETIPPIKNDHPCIDKKGDWHLSYCATLEAYDPSYTSTWDESYFYNSIVIYLVNLKNDIDSLDRKVYNYYNNLDRFVKLYNLICFYYARYKKVSTTNEYIKRFSRVLVVLIEHCLDAEIDDKY